MSRRLALAGVLITLIGFPAIASPPRRRVVLVSLDGLRPDAIAKTATPALDALIARGLWAENATTILPSITLPSHTSMLTGLLPARHRVIFWNSYRRKRGLIQHTTVVERVAAGGQPTAIIAGKHKLWHLSRGAGVWIRCGSDPLRVARVAVAYLKEQRPRLLVVHSSEPDSSGHRHGWLSPQQLTAITRADRALGRIVAQVERDPVLRREVIWIVTADHGGHRKTHGSGRAVDMRIPWICAGPGIRQGRLAQPVRTVDTAATVLALLGLPVPPDLDGKPVDGLHGPAR